MRRPGFLGDGHNFMRPRAARQFGDEATAHINQIANLVHGSGRAVMADPHAPSKERRILEKTNPRKVAIQTSNALVPIRHDSDSYCKTGQITVDGKCTWPEKKKASAEHTADVMKVKELRKKTKENKQRGHAARQRMFRIPPGLAKKPELAARWEAKKKEIEESKEVTRQKAEKQTQAWGHTRPEVAKEWAEEDAAEEAKHAVELETEATQDEAEQTQHDQRMKNVPEAQRAALEETWAKQQLDKKEKIAQREVAWEQRRQDRIQGRENWQETKDGFFNFFAPVLGWEKRIIPE